MKRFLPLLLCVLFACTKDVNSPLSQDEANQTQTDAIKKQAKHSQPKTISYKYSFYGNTGEGFDITFPAFNINTGTLTGWTLTVNRYVSGTATLTNMLNVRNDSAISISRYLEVDMGVLTPIATLPTSVIKYLPQKLAANQTATVNINTIVNDIILSVASNKNDVLGDATGKITWHFSDLISGFKPNCENSFDLKDSVIISVTYTYIQN